MRTYTILLPDDKHLDTSRDISFEIKRVYYMYNVPPNTTRGKHAHIKLKQALHCPVGSCKISIDDGVNKEIYTLDSPQKILVIEGMVWRELFDFSSDVILSVFADDVYDEKDYVRDYEYFLELTKNKTKKNASV